MNEFDRLFQMSKGIKERYPAGTRIELISMGNDPMPVEDGTKGTVIHVDDMGTVHCQFDNGRQLGLIPGEDNFRRLTIEEINYEKYAEKQDEFLDALDSSVIPFFNLKSIKDAYKNNDMSYPIELLKLMCNDFKRIYESNDLSLVKGEVVVPGVVEACNENIYPALISIDCSEQGKILGTTVFTENGILNDMSDNPYMNSEIEKFQPFNYLYAAKFDEDVYMNVENCPYEAKLMINEALEEEFFEEEAMTY